MLDHKNASLESEIRSLYVSTQFESILRLQPEALELCSRSKPVAEWLIPLLLTCRKRLLENSEIDGAEKQVILFQDYQRIFSEVAPESIPLSVAEEVFSQVQSGFLSKPQSLSLLRLFLEKCRAAGYWNDDLEALKTRYLPAKALLALQLLREWWQRFLSVDFATLKQWALKVFSDERIYGSIILFALFLFARRSRRTLAQQS